MGEKIGRMRSAIESPFYVHIGTSKSSIFYWLYLSLTSMSKPNGQLGKKTAAATITTTVFIRCLTFRFFLSFFLFLFFFIEIKVPEKENDTTDSTIRFYSKRVAFFRF